MTDIEDLESKLLEMYSHRGDGILTQYVIPVGPAAFALITSLRAEVAALREGLRRIKIEADRESGGWVHLKRSIAVNCAALLERTDNETK